MAYTYTSEGATLAKTLKAGQSKTFVDTNQADVAEGVGVFDTMKIIVIATGCLWPILLNTVEGVRRVDSLLLETAKVYRLGPLAQLRVLLRAASPQIVAGARQALSIGIILMVISEMFAANNGLGFSVVQFQRPFAIPEMWTGIIVLGLLGVALSGVPCAGTPRPGLAPGSQASNSRRKLTEARPAPGADMLVVDNLHKVYAGADGGTEAIRNLTFDVKAGELVCIVGPSGAGKTTLLRSIAGLLPPTSGTVTMEGQVVNGPPRGMAVVFQEYARSLFPWLTVRGNVELPLKEKKLPKQRRIELTDEALEAVGLTEAANQYPWQLSGGMQQRVAIARAVAYEPHLLLMDEPFAAVDAQTRADLEDLVRTLWHKYGVTMLFVTHDIDESIYLAQRVLVLSGRPTVIMEDVHVGLPDERDQITTRSDPEFARLRTHVHQLVQAAKRGERLDEATGPERLAVNGRR